MRSFLLSPIPIFLAVIVFTLFSLPKISGSAWAKIGRISAIILFFASIATWYFALNSKVEAGRQGYHRISVSKVTNHVEQLLTEGKYSEAKNVIAQFNRNYPVMSTDPEELEILVGRMVDQTQDPANHALKRDAAKTRRAP